jgi:hypothetical protein
LNLFVVPGISADLFPKQELKCNEEFKQDGLLMLEFSNSQSRKEFTASEKITQDYAQT